MKWTWTVVALFGLLCGAMLVVIQAGGTWHWIGIGDIALNSFALGLWVATPR